MLGPLSITAVAMAGVATAAGYHTMSPTSQLYGATLVRSRNKRQLALTYDDGPNDPYTLNLLDVLAKHGVRATFFMLGQRVVERPKIAETVARAGHSIGNHSHTHPNLILSSTAQRRHQIEACERAMTDAVGRHSKLFRPPFGGRTPGVLQMARQMNYLPVMWSVTAYDWRPYSPEKIEQIVARQVRGGDILLLHDGGHLRMGVDRSASVAVTDRIIRRYKDQGFEFVTVEEMVAESCHSEPPKRAKCL
jgi:peptidoglycan/xylan/chitin deacetylase (PgdA/CDA1 family)